MTAWQMTFPRVRTLDQPNKTKKSLVTRHCRMEEYIGKFAPPRIKTLAEAGILHPLGPERLPKGEAQVQY